jgi:hypothetical protein
MPAAQIFPASVATHRSTAEQWSTTQSRHMLPSCIGDALQDNGIMPNSKLPRPKPSPRLLLRYMEETLALLDASHCRRGEGRDWSALDLVGNEWSRRVARSVGRKRVLFSVCARLFYLSERVTVEIWYLLLRIQVSHFRYKDYRASHTHTQAKTLEEHICWSIRTNSPHKKKITGRSLVVLSGNPCAASLR